MKAAAIQCGRSVSLELAPRQIRVSAVCPGVVVTPIVGRAAAMDTETADATTERGGLLLAGYA